MEKALLSSHTALLIKCAVKATSDVAIVAGKVYYEANGDIYEPVNNPVVADIADYCEIVADGTASATSAFVKVVCIKDIPDLGGDPETIETTDLCDDAQTYIEGLMGNDTLSFTANFNQYVLHSINTILKGVSREVAIVFGDLAGKDGKFTFTGQVSGRMNGFGVNEVREMTINIVPTSSIAQVLPNA